MKKTYRAMQIARPGVLELVERETPQPGQAEVLIEVEACGLCGADAADIDGARLEGALQLLRDVPPGSLRAVPRPALRRVRSFAQGWPRSTR